LRTLHRDLAALAAEGWRIDTLETANTPAVRVLRTVDNRFATVFTPAERAELARAAACAGADVADALADDLGRAPADQVPFHQAFVDGRGRLAVCQAATADRCQVAFTYGGKPRVVHPVGLLLRPAGWYLRALDTGDGKVKTFHVDRMRRMSMGEPGSARPVPEEDLALQQPVMDPMALPIHDPITIEVDTDPANLPDVLTALARQGHTLWSPDSEDPDLIRVSIDVTNTHAFIARLFQLGRRVRLVGPEPIRAQVRDQLLQAVGTR
jgi:predicted DNA-binding transcriptional regulator YafY